MKIVRPLALDPTARSDALLSHVDQVVLILERTFHEKELTAHCRRPGATTPSAQRSGSLAIFAQSVVRCPKQCVAAKGALKTSTTKERQLTARAFSAQLILWLRWLRKAVVQVVEICQLLPQMLPQSGFSDF